MTWNVSPILIDLGALQIRWYGLLFAFGFLVGFEIIKKIYKREGYSEEAANALLNYMIIGTVIGSRLGHCLFYEPEYYLANPLEILKIWNGGLASHGGTAGIFISLYFYTKKYSTISWRWIVDRCTVPVAFAAGCIRTGNLFNSEIIGIPTDGWYGIVFEQVDTIARHPTQVYEAIAYYSLFIFLMFFYWKWIKEKKGPAVGVMTGFFFIWVFSSRFLIEIVKEVQASFESNMALKMGQWLSLPFIAFGCWSLYRGLKSKKS